MTFRLSNTEEANKILRHYELAEMEVGSIPHPKCIDWGYHKL
jgi:hypothetical protein